MLLMKLTTKQSPRVQIKVRPLTLKKKKKVLDTQKKTLDVNDTNRETTETEEMQMVLVMGVAKLEVVGQKKKLIE